MATSDVRDQLQTALGAQYTLERELGRGGTATVYLAQDTKHRRSVALKVLHPELALALGPERFRREIELAAGLQHPHILSVFDSGETATGQLWFTMPFIEGESLRDRLLRERQLPVADAIRIARDAAQALQYAHAHGVIHRDIKPENLLLTRDGNTLVADFGVARTVDGGGGDDGATLTTPGMVMGTPAYMSPEQASGERLVDARSDVYALGAVLYEMLAGEAPFTGSAQAVFAKRLATVPPPVSVLRAGVPPGVTAAVATALARSPTDRYATAAAFGTALETAERTGAPPPHASRRRVPTGIAFLGLGFVVGIGALFAWRNRAAAPRAVAAPAAAAAAPVGLAVLPFDNEGDTAYAYLTNGITDEIRGKLAQLTALRLVASASSNQYHHSTKPQDQIGRELGVRYLLTGTVRWEQGANGARRVRVSPELVEVQDGVAPQTRWQQSYDTTLADVFDVQSAVATRVADKLGVVLSPPAQSQLASHPTQNLPAYEAYLRSVALQGNDPPTLRRGLAAAERAVTLDSNFAAAWARVSVFHSILYSNSTPTRTDAEGARHAADRAVALAPRASEGYIARGLYHLQVAYDVGAARGAFETALRLAPSSPEANRRLADAEAAVGQWQAALGHVRQAAALDPRSAIAAERSSRMLLWLRRYPEARGEAERGLSLAPDDLSLTHDRTLSLLGEGNLAGARVGLRDVPPTLDRAALAAYMANYFDLYWVLDSADRALVLTLPPAAFDNDHAVWGTVRAEVFWLAGDTMQARRYADSARVAFEMQLRATPNDSQLHLFRGLALAYLGHAAAAVREGDRGLALALATGDEFQTIPYARHVLARLCVAAGDPAHALDELDSVLAKPYFMSPAWLTIDPSWAPLKGNPRFERLTPQPAPSERPPE